MTDPLTPAPLAIVARSHGIEILQNPFLSPRMIESLNTDKYERMEIESGLAMIPPGARMLEMGAGAGVVGAVLARNLNLAAVLSIEANPDLIPHIQAMHRHNGLSDVITLAHSVVLSDPDAPDQVTFHVRGNFLGSGLQVPEDRASRPVQVPVLHYGALRIEFPHDAIMMDIEGGELDFLRHADLSGVNVLVAEFHRGVYGRDGVQECMRLLRRAGLTQVEDVGSGAVRAFRRG